MSIGVTKSAFACLLAGCLAVLAASAATAMPYFVSVQPIQVCMDDGITCANPDRQVFQTATDTIWAQAGIEVRFEDWNVFNSTAYFNLDTGSELIPLFNAAGNGKSADALTLNMFFVQDIDASGSYYGLTLGVGLNGIVIGSSAILNYNGGIGRLDTIAHEIGHSLGLGHTTFGAGASNNLMTDGGARQVPGSIDDIAPGGLGLDLLVGLQIDKVLTSNFVQDNPDFEPPTSPVETVSAPGGLVPVAAGLLVLAVLTLRRRGATGPMPAAA